MINGQIPYYTTQQAAEMLGMSGSNVLLLLKAGKLKDVSTKKGPRMGKRIDVASIHHYAAALHEKRAAATAKRAAMKPPKAPKAPKASMAPQEAPPLHALVEKQIAQTQEVIRLLSSLVALWSGTTSAGS